MDQLRYEYDEEMRLLRRLIARGKLVVVPTFSHWRQARGWRGRWHTVGNADYREG